ncbi:calcium/manganese antiporter SLC30A10 isoform X1 [Poecile atricapillus]|uniref:calcium/manganese antiporter SLC30A10 isoform X1 n=1 Tax=Poecile atricapillus TaxID=48891 RepID=UPI002739135A|nr:calcium/manganese antiporter SLC30A10 isoform X1 [Poecile atricapillus]
MGRYSGKTCRLIFMLVLTAGFFVAELVSGYLGNSIALVSDSFNMLSDLISLCVGLSTGRIARRSRRGPRATYGYSRAEAVGALSNAVFLTALCFTILVDSVLRLARPEPIDDAQLVLIVGTLGLAVNVVGLLVFQDWGACCRGRRPSPAPPAAAALRDAPGGTPNGGEDEAGDSPNDQKSPEVGSEKKKEKKSEALNIRGIWRNSRGCGFISHTDQGVLLHVMGDALGSVVVVVTAAIFYIRPLGNAPCNWQCYIDPSLTIAMVFIILSSAFPLIKETSTILLQMVPKGVNMQLLTDRLARVPGVSSLHEVHVWELASGKNIATLHIKCQAPSDYQDADYKIRKVFHEAGVHSVTIQPEYADHKSSHLLCNSPCISKACDSHLCCSQREPLRAETNGYVEKSESSLSAQHKDNGSRKSDIEILMEDPVVEESVKNVKNCDMSDDKSQSGSTRF